MIDDILTFLATWGRRFLTGIILMIAMLGVTALVIALLETVSRLAGSDAAWIAPVAVVWAAASFLHTLSEY